MHERANMGEVKEVIKMGELSKDTCHQYLKTLLKKCRKDKLKKIRCTSKRELKAV